MGAQQPYFGPGGSGPEAWRDHLRGMRYGFVLLAILLIAAIVLIAARKEPNRTTFTLSERQQAWNACVDAVARRLDAPAAEAEPFSNAGVTLVGERRYEVKVRYPARAAFHTCVVSASSRVAGAWDLWSVR